MKFKNLAFFWFLVSFSVFTTLFSAAPSSAADQTWKGSVKLWTADLCDRPALDILLNPNCSPVPKPLGVQWAVELPIKEELAPGFHVVSRTTLVQEPWTVTVLVTRTNPTNGVPSFLAVQTTLKEKNQGIVAQCSRYDAVGTFSFLPPGACSGQLRGKLVGVSLLSPYVAAAP